VRKMTTFLTSLTLVAALAAPAREAQAQTRFSASVGVGSLFDGVGFGLSVGSYAPGSAFFGLSFGLGWAHSYGSPYGIYSDMHDGWQRGYRGHRARVYGYASCGDPFWGPVWDPWYDDCFGYGPAWGYMAYRPWGWGFHNGYWNSSMVILSDPFATPWGPYWSYDPWGGYWDSWGFGVRSAWGRRHYGGVRVVYGGGRRGWGTYRPSPLARVGPTYKEGPTVQDGRTARRRGQAGVAPAPSRPTVQGNPRAIPGWGSAGRTARPEGGVRAPSRPGATSPAAPTRTARPSVRTPAGRTAPRPTDRLGNRGSPGRVVSPPTRTSRPAAGSTRGESGRTPTARPTDGGARSRPSGTRTRDPLPSTRNAPNGVIDLRSSPSERGTTSRPSRAVPSRATPTRVTPWPTSPSRAAPTRATPSRGAPSRAVPTRSAPTRAVPSRTPSTRSEPAPRARPSSPSPRTSAPRASAPRTSAPRAAPARPRTGGGGRAAPARSRTGGGGRAAPPRRGGGGGL